MTLYRTFFVPHTGGEAAQEAMDAFIRGHRTLAVERAVFPNGWAFCVEWMEGAGPSAPVPAAGFRGGKVDYREVLEPAAFDRFVRLRKARMEIAEADGVKPFVVMTDAQMAQLAKAERPTKADLGRIEGFGEARVAKYGERLLGAAVTSDERRVTSGAVEREDLGDAASCRVGREEETRQEAASPSCKGGDALVPSGTRLEGASPRGAPPAEGGA
ncbi:MAG: HRDC domain-containing protein [Kiritimatiellae bacterium]|nr:HRDC domain-containing protein [Kiritimatiellia bacterium]